MPSGLRSDKVKAETTVKARRSSSIPDSASEEHILGGIQISRSVLQEASYDGKIKDDLADMI